VATVLTHNTIITAHCQAFDQANHCDKLDVGKRYDLERDKNQYLDYLTLYDKPKTAGDRKVITTLAVVAERVR